MNKEKIREALKAACSLIVVEVWAPPVHQFEIDRRFEARNQVQKMCMEALHELDKEDATAVSSQARPMNGHYHELLLRCRADFSHRVVRSAFKLLRIHRTKRFLFVQVVQW